MLQNVFERRWEEIAILFTRHGGWVPMWGLRSFGSWRPLWQSLFLAAVGLGLLATLPSTTETEEESDGQPARSVILQL